MVSIEETQWRSIYPMDNYADDGGVWTNYYGKKRINNELKSTEAKDRIRAARAARKKTLKIEYTS